MKTGLRAFFMVLLLGGLMLPADTPDAARKKRQYGAIAYDFRDHRYGASFNLWSRRVAQRVARQKCRTPRCKVLVWFYDTCAVLAVSREMKPSFGNRNAKPRMGWGSFYGYGIHRDRKTATRIALAKCNKALKRMKTFDRCQMRVWACSFG